MQRIIVSTCLLMLYGCAAGAQTSTTKARSSNEDFCRANPHAAICTAEKPVDGSKPVVKPEVAKPVQKQTSNSAPANNVQEVRNANGEVPSAQPKGNSSGDTVVYGLPGGPKTIEPTPAPPADKMVIYGLPGGPKVL